MGFENVLNCLNMVVGLSKCVGSVAGGQLCIRTHTCRWNTLEGVNNKKTFLCILSVLRVFPDALRVSWKRNCEYRVLHTDVAFFGTLLKKQTPSV